MLLIVLNGFLTDFFKVNICYPRLWSWQLHLDYSMSLGTAATSFFLLSLVIAFFIKIYNRVLVFINWLLQRLVRQKKLTWEVWTNSPCLEQAFDLSCIKQVALTSRLVPWSHSFPEMCQFHLYCTNVKFFGVTFVAFLDEFADAFVHFVVFREDSRVVFFFALSLRWSRQVHASNHQCHLLQRRCFFDWWFCNF